jgi:hypothetical protein
MLLDVPEIVMPPPEITQPSNTHGPVTLFTVIAPFGKVPVNVPHGKGSTLGTLAAEKGDGPTA